VPRPSRHGVELAAIGAGALAAGLVLGAAAERYLAGRMFGPGEDALEGYGQLQAPAHRLELPDGVGLHVEVEEPEGFREGVDPTLIFAHGFTLNSQTWYYQRRDLVDIGRIVVYDQRSHGRSDRGPEGSNTIDQLGLDLAEVIKDTAGSGPVVLIGHSMGGMTVMALAHQHPELFGPQVRGVALLSTSSGGLDSNTYGLPKAALPLMRRYWQDVAASLAARQPTLGPARARANDLAFMLTKMYSFGGWSSVAMTRFVNGMISATPIDVLVEFLPTLLSHDKADALAALEQVPTLILVGDHDLMTPLSHSREMSQRLPDARFVVVPAAGHMAFLERHEVVDGHLRALVREAMGG
jgi:pimeloyl-ACP methyl ester carboxylesterase